MRKNVLREKLDTGEPSIGTRALSSWPGVMEIIGHCGQMDYVEFSGEYAPYDLHDLDNLARASELFDMSTMIKVDQSIQTFLAQRALGSGIQNVLFTDIRSVEDAKKCVRAVRAETPETGGIFPCTMRRHVGYMKEAGTEEFVQAMEDVVVGIMIEKESAVKNLEDILSVEGIDMVQFGPCDYSMSVGMVGRRGEEKIQQAERHVIETALEMGVQPRAELTEPKEAKYYLDLGVRHFNIGVDVVILHNWLKEKGAALRDMVSDL